GTAPCRFLRFTRERMSPAERSSRRRGSQGPRRNMRSCRPSSGSADGTCDSAAERLSSFPRGVTLVTDEIPPARPASYDKKVGLVLQGGGALGSYQAGVYEALASSQYLPDWVAGISIGAINAAIIAGNSPEVRIEKLREFWRTITTPAISPVRISDLVNCAGSPFDLGKQISAMRAL